MMRACPLARSWHSHALARLALVCALLGQLLAPAQAAPAPLPPQAQAIIATFGADALCLVTDPGHGKADHGLACLACPTHCASGIALAPVAASPALRTPTLAAVTPPATAPPGVARPRSDLTAHGPPSRLS